MYKATFVLSILAAILITESSCQGFRIIHPTYRPPPRKPVIIRTVREAPADEPLWLNQGDIPRAPATGDHPYLPNYIDDIQLDPNRRYARSLDLPSEFREDDNHSAPGRDIRKGPGTIYNYREPRSIRLPFDPLPKPSKPLDPFNPFPRPGPRPRFPIYV